MSVKIDKIAAFERGWEDGYEHRAPAGANMSYYEDYSKGYKAGLSWGRVEKLLVQGCLFDGY